ncbi:MAG: hypothetical protein CM1200mP13_05080 [Candidatus Pelagibacterales bacterium]|nr:MAG: hypothetical protein CM1200mP13_05080 [Pelagibacterales bacterium]
MPVTLLQQLRVMMLKSALQSDPLLLIHVRVQVDQPQLKKWMLVKSFQIQNLSKEKKLNLMPELGTARIVVSGGEECKVGNFKLNFRNC